MVPLTLKIPIIGSLLFASRLNADDTLADIVVANDELIQAFGDAFEHRLFGVDRPFDPLFGEKGPIDPAFGILPLVTRPPLDPEYGEEPNKDDVDEDNSDGDSPPGWSPVDTTTYKAFFDWKYWVYEEECYNEFINDQDRFGYQECCHEHPNSTNCLHYRNALNISLSEPIPNSHDAFIIDTCWFFIPGGALSVNAGLLGYYPNENWAKCCFEMCSYGGLECPYTHFCRPLDFVLLETNDSYWYLWLSIAGFFGFAIVIAMCYFLCSCCAVGGILGKKSKTPVSPPPVIVAVGPDDKDPCMATLEKTKVRVRKVPVDPDAPIARTSSTEGLYATMTSPPVLPHNVISLDESVILAPASPINCPFETV